jgi:hypothetical protein
MEQMKNRVNLVGKRAKAAMINASPMERIKRALGMLPSEEILNFQTTAQMLAADLSEAEAIYGSAIGFEPPSRAVIRNRTVRRLRRESALFTNLERANAFTSHLTLGLIPGEQIEDWYISAFGSGIEAQENVKYKKKQIETIETIRKDERERYERDPRYDLNRLFERNRRLHVRAYEADVRTRRQFWGMI